MKTSTFFVLIIVVAEVLAYTHENTYTASSKRKNFGSHGCGNYRSNWNRLYTISGTEGDVLHLEFTMFHTEEDDDTVRVFDKDGELTTTPLSGWIRRSSLPSFSTTTGELRVVFVTDGSRGGSGFRAKYQSIPAAVDGCATDSDCGSHASCWLAGSMAECACDEGFEGDASTGCTDIDECATSPCHRRATCSNTDGGYTCSCPDGFWGSGRHGCWDINECWLGTHDCHSRASCDNTFGGYECKCHRGWTGDGRDCDEDTSCYQELSASSDPQTFSSNPDSWRYANRMDCTWNITASPGSVVELEFKRFWTERRYDFVYVSDKHGALLDPLHGHIPARKIDSVSSEDWIAVRMTTDWAVRSFGFVAEYISSGTSFCPGGCPSNAECVNAGSGFECVCNPGYVDDSASCVDIDECVAAPCDALATCDNFDGGFSCTCPVGYAGDGTTCVQIDECTDLTDDCSPNAACADTDGGWTCTCGTGFVGEGHGEDGCSDLNECSLGGVDCHALADCENTVGSYGCVCQSGYNGDGIDCTPIDYCSAGVCSENAACTNTPGVGSGYSCVCNDPYVGDGVVCLLPCDTITCPENSDCSLKDGSPPECECHVGYEGGGSPANPCEDIDECAIGICSSSGCNCVNTPGSFTCTCGAGYRAVDWEGVPDCENVDECTEGSPCEQICTDTPGAYECSCSSGYTVQPDGSCLDFNECQPGEHDCFSLSSCTNIPGSFTCSCPAGYVGDGRSCEDEDECSTGTPCDVNAACTNEDGSFSCECNSGFSGDGFPSNCIDIPECAAVPGPCGANAECAEIPGSYTCTCIDGWVGDGITCTDEKECASATSHDCDKTHGICIEEEGSYSCECLEGFETADEGVTCTDIDECLVVSCPGSSVCDNTAPGYTCICNPGYGGPECSDIDECLVGLPSGEPACHANAACANNGGGYTCSCNPGYSGDGVVSCSNINECAEGTDTCDDVSEVCADTDGAFECNCAVGYTGPGCTDVDECTSFPCVEFASCTNTVGSFTCECDSGYELDAGTGACFDIPECDTIGCGANTNCVENAPGAGRTCSCMAGYQSTGDLSAGDDCVDIDECAAGSDDCAAGECQNTEGGFVCCPVGYSLNGGTGMCEDDDECIANPCGTAPNVLPCENTPGSFTCSCDVGYVASASLPLSCTNQDECLGGPNDCDGNAICADTEGSYTCTCQAGYMGDGIECADVDECAAGECDAASTTCTNSEGGFSCACLPGFKTGATATSCDDINECSETTNCVQPLTVCTNSIGSYTCECEAGATPAPGGVEVDGCTIGLSAEDVAVDGGALVPSPTGTFNVGGSFVATGGLGGEPITYELSSGTTDLAITADGVVRVGAGNCVAPSATLALSGGTFTVTGRDNVCGISASCSVSFQYVAKQTIDGTLHQSDPATVTVTFASTSPGSLDIELNVFGLTDSFSTNFVGGTFPVGTGVSTTLDDLRLVNLDFGCVAYEVLQVKVVEEAATCSYCLTGAPHTTPALCDTIEGPGASPSCLSQQASLEPDPIFNRAALAVSGSYFSDTAVVTSAPVLNVLFAPVGDFGSTPPFDLSFLLRVSTDQATATAWTTSVTSASTGGTPSLLVESDSEEQEKKNAEHTSKMARIEKSTSILGALLLVCAALGVAVFVVKGGCKSDNDVDRTGFEPMDNDDDALTNDAANFA